MRVLAAPSCTGLRHSAGACPRVAFQQPLAAQLRARVGVTVHAADTEAVGAASPAAAADKPATAPEEPARASAPAEAASTSAPSAQAEPAATPKPEASPSSSAAADDTTVTAPDEPVSSSASDEASTSAAGADAAASKPAQPSRGKAKQRLSQAEFPVKVKDKVVGRVIFASQRGARVALVDHPGVIGYLPKNRGPYAIRDAFSSNPYVAGTFGADEGCVPKGLTRIFQVIAIPDDMEVNGKGPLLAANNIDLKLMWRRMQQMLEVSSTLRETFKVQVHGVTERGLLVTLAGLRGFVPIGHIPKEDQQWLERDDLQRLYHGKEIEVSLLAVDASRTSFTCSLRDAATHKALRGIKIGSLVWGTVRIVRDYGVFVAIDDTFESALLHISNMSWDRVDDTETLFEEGDRVRAVVIGMDDGYTRISISTKDIESEAGDMLGDKKAVYAAAEENVKPFLANVAEWEANEAARAEEQDWQSSGADAMEDEDFRS